MDNGYQITLTRVGDRTYNWMPRSRVSRLLVTLTGLALLIALVSLAIGAILISALVVTLLVFTGMVRLFVRRWLYRRRARTRAF